SARPRAIAAAPAECAVRIARGHPLEAGPSPGSSGPSRNQGSIPTSGGMRSPHRKGVPIRHTQSQAVGTHRQTPDRAERLLPALRLHPDGLPTSQVWRPERLISEPLSELCGRVVSAKSIGQLAALAQPEVRSRLVLLGRDWLALEILSAPGPPVTRSRVKPAPPAARGHLAAPNNSIPRTMRLCVSSPSLSPSNCAEPSLSGRGRDEKAPGNGGRLAARSPGAQRRFASQVARENRNRSCAVSAIVLRRCRLNFRSCS